jgi:SAM-dependent methyltransferase
MRIDIHSLERFYASELGQAALRMAARRLAALWPHADGRDVLGVGYPLPFLERYRAGARRVVALLPALQGASRWPGKERGLVALADENRFPFADSVFDRVLLAHALEEAESAGRLLREVWRVTAPEGRIVIVAANRLGLWARADATPFGHGRPFSREQLAQVLADAMFAPAAAARALYVPPIRWTAKFAFPFERTGETLWPAFGGLIFMEGVKRLYATPAGEGVQALAARAPKPAQALPAEAA